MSDGARILDRGYRTYDGPRGGVRGAMRSVEVQSIQRVLGIKRSFWTKIVPVLTVFIAYVPAIVFIGLAVLVPDEILQPGETSEYAGYYGVISAAILVFAAFAGPEVLCPDRRTGMLGLYLASPLDRDTYLLAKGAATTFLLSLVTLGPPLLLLIGYTAAGAGPDGFGGWILVFARILAAGIAFALFFALLTLAISSTTTRHAVATVSIIIVLLASSAAANYLVEVAETPAYFGLIGLFEVPMETVARIYGEALQSDTGEEGFLEAVPTWAVAAAYLAWTVGLATFTRFRYQRLDVTR